MGEIWEKKQEISCSVFKLLNSWKIGLPDRKTIVNKWLTFKGSRTSWLGTNPNVSVVGPNFKSPKQKLGIA